MWLALGGCSNIDTESFRTPDFVTNLRLPSASAPATAAVLPAVTAADLVDGEGRCAGAPQNPAVAATEGADGDLVTVPANAATATGGIGLTMTECEVVKRAGPPEKVQLGSNERAERTAVLTYLWGLRPGIYNFTAGRLVTIDRAPEPPAPPKPAKPAKPAKPKRAAT
jgi:hypothetical protein